MAVRFSEIQVKIPLVEDTECSADVVLMEVQTQKRYCSGPEECVVGGCGVD